MKSLKVVSIGSNGEHTTLHPLWDCDYEDALIIATLQGVIKAGHTIKSFELVEA